MKQAAQAKIAHLRDNIDAIDSRLLRLLVKRQMLARAIGKEKHTHALAISDPRRERKIIKTQRKQGKAFGLSETFITEVMTIIIKEAKRAQKGTI